MLLEACVPAGLRRRAGPWPRTHSALEMPCGKERSLVMTGNLIPPYQPPGFTVLLSHCRNF